MRLSLLACIAAVASLGSPAAANDADHERARKAVARGEAMPLDAMLQHLARIAPGEVIEIEFERENGRWVYEFKVLQADGAIREVEMDAKTARVLEIEIEKP
ncbi:PepSY domain-containing protein [Caulobacter sp. NIBR2454]|uniref:PepSY domain-containing protein n=1 Tax=Caulobacter sp. NIBR2454 TaxID=3015996 RepID=UPI0022B6C624|nr:PepSY domain-containing protein [Caulobacter sp. NIBR2454]